MAILKTKFDSHYPPPTPHMAYPPTHPLKAGYVVSLFLFCFVLVLFGFGFLLCFSAAWENAGPIFLAAATMLGKYFPPPIPLPSPRYPTWDIAGTLLPGEKSLGELEAILPRPLWGDPRMSQDRFGW